MARNILFLCTGNSARSQMGEALLRKHAGNVFNAFSAGTEPKDEIFPPVVKAMEEIGLDLSDQKPQDITEFLGRERFEKVIIVCSNAEQRCPAIFGPSERMSWPFEDPAAASGSEQEVLAATREIRDQIDRKIQEWLAEQSI